MSYQKWEGRNIPCVSNPRPHAFLIVHIWLISRRKAKAKLCRSFPYCCILDANWLYFVQSLAKAAFCEYVGHVFLSLGRHLAEDQRLGGRGEVGDGGERWRALAHRPGDSPSNPTPIPQSASELFYLPSPLGILSVAKWSIWPYRGQI